MKTIHTVPDNDLLNHYQTPKCQCNPFYIHDQHIIHNSYDHRELFEMPWYKLNIPDLILRLWLVISKQSPDLTKTTWSNWEVIEDD